MNDHVGQQTIRQILSSALKVYGTHFRVVLLAFLPAVPFAILHEVALGYTWPKWLTTLTAGLNYFVSLFVVPLVMTVIVLDIKRGNPPSLSRAFRRVRALTIYKFAVTYLWAGLLFSFVGFFSIALDFTVGMPSPQYVAPLVIAVIFFLYSAIMFFPSVLLLQNLWGLEALKRSASLGKGRYLRNAGIVIGIYLTHYFIYAVLITLWKGFLLTTIISNLVGLMIKPVALICLVLIYYEMRKRKDPHIDLERLALEVG